ncbi:MAG: hypothetical protein U0Q22_05695 [Acidimicrobiales bacterium]
MVTLSGRATTVRQGSSIALRAAGTALEFVGYVILARRLGPGAFGQISVALVIVRFAALLGDSGAGYGGTREVASRGVDSPRVWAWQRNRQIRSVGLAVVFVVACAVSGHVALMPFAIGLVARGAHRDWIALGEGAVVRSSAPGIVHGLVIVTGAALVSSLGAAAMVAGAAAAAWIATSAVLNPRPAHAAPAAGSDTGGLAGRTATIGSWGLVALFADSLVQSLDVVLLSFLRSNAEAGVYAAVYRIPNALLLLLGLSVTSAVPRMVALHADPEAAPALRRRCLRLGAVLAAVTLTIGLVAVGTVGTVFGPAYTAGRRPLLLLLLATTFTAFSVPLRTLQLVTGSDRAVARAAVTNSLLVTAGYLVLIPRWGMIGAAAATAVAQFLYLVFFVAVTAGSPTEAAAVSPSPVRPATSRT